MVEAAEGHVSCGKGRRRHNVRRRGIGAITEKTVGQADRAFGITGEVRIGRIDKRIGDAVVHRFDAGASAVSEVGHLEGRGFQGEERQAIRAGVEAKVDEDVNLIGADDLGGPLVGDGVNISPDIGGGARRAVMPSGWATLA